VIESNNSTQPKLLVPVGRTMIDDPNGCIVDSLYKRVLKENSEQIVLSDR